MSKKDEVKDLLLDEVMRLKRIEEEEERGDKLMVFELMKFLLVGWKSRKEIREKFSLKNGLDMYFIEEVRELIDYDKFVMYEKYDGKEFRYVIR